MTIEQHTLTGRREAEKLMTTTGTIGTVTEGMDPDTFETIEVITPVYTGKLRIRQATPKSSDATAGGQQFPIQSLILSLPIDGSGEVTTNMAVLVTANPLDAALVGTKYRITGTSAQSHATARRFEIERTN